MPDVGRCNERGKLAAAVEYLNTEGYIVTKKTKGGIVVTPKIKIMTIEQSLSRVQNSWESVHS